MVVLEVRGWIIRRRVAQYRQWQALDEKEAWVEAWSRLRIAAFVAARVARQAQVDRPLPSVHAPSVAPT